jgi:hypothetical protein
MEEKEESNQHRTHTQKEREYDKQLFLLLRRRRLLLLPLLLSLVRSLLFACSDRRGIYVCMSSTCSLFLYRAMYVSFHCCRSLAHTDIVIEHNEKEKGEREASLRSLHHRFFFHQSIFLLH